ncbi:MAG: diaminopimelate decarboxylase [Proteobacteria bacterium]|nr:diaminopimelate decarboxylase [Pseudomonadota bacterium]
MSFARRDGELCAEDVPVREIADSVGTPVYIYSAAALAERLRALGEAFAGVRHLVCFSVKCNGNLAVLRTLCRGGAGADITSVGELARAQRAGIPGDRIVYSGVGKRRDEIDAALAAGIKLFNVESREELRAIDAVARARGVRAPVAFRVNPDVDPKTHPYIATGLRTSKFGIPWAEAGEAYAEAKALANVSVVGVDCHIGSQLLDVAPFAEALARVRTLVGELRAAGHAIAVVDVGGGLGVDYSGETPPSVAAYADAVRTALADLGCEIVLEPGRAIAGPAGLFVTRVLYRKRGGDKRFVVVDGAMNDLIRPALYGAHQPVQPVAPARGEPAPVDVVGPVCESADFLAQDRPLPPLEPGDLLAFGTAGAYGFVMASNYNARPRAAEVLVRGDRFAVVREREVLEDLFRGETIPEEFTA